MSQTGLYVGTSRNVRNHPLPVGIGLTIGLCASVALWVLIGMGFLALVA